MTDDPFGFDRFQQQQYWRCSGRIDVTNEEAVEPDEPRQFVVARGADRWLYTANDATLVVIGDATRDLVPRGGGLIRLPAGHGFEPYWSAGVVRQTGVVSRAFVADSEIVKQRDENRNGRPTTVLDLEHPSGSTYTLGIDVESGIWMSLATPIFTLTVDRLDLRAQDRLDFYLLDVVHDIRWPKPEPVRPALAPMAQVVEQASGLKVAAIDQHEQAVEFDFLLLDGDQTVGRITHRRALLDQSPARFGGDQSWIAGDDWETHVDLACRDNRTAHEIMRAVTATLPRP